MALHFAATYPGRTIALLLYGTFARSLRAADYPIGPPVESRLPSIENLRRSWGALDSDFLHEHGPSVAEDPGQRA